MRKFLKTNALAVVLGVMLVAPTHADIGIIPLRQLVSQVDLIVVAHIIRIELEQQGEARFGVAIARVDEVWKGSTDLELRVNLARWSACDISTAIKGEQVLLFLERDPASGGSDYRIGHQGRGRMPIETIDGQRLCKGSGVVGGEDLPSWEARTEKISLASIKQAVTKIGETRGHLPVR